jgi:hypothetical protein
MPKFFWFAYFALVCIFGISLCVDDVKVGHRLLCVGTILFMFIWWLKEVLY